MITLGCGSCWGVLYYSQVDASRRQQRMRQQQVPAPPPKMNAPKQF
jgi:hypothetical protein